LLAIAEHAPFMLFPPFLSLVDLDVQSSAVMTAMSLVGSKVGRVVKVGLIVVVGVLVDNVGGTVPELCSTVSV
jgi:hypothetical protein